MWRGACRGRCRQIEMRHRLIKISQPSEAGWSSGIIGTEVLAVGLPGVSTRRRNCDTYRR